MYPFCLVPPDKPVIFDGRRHDKTKLVEPYNEGSDVSLTCEVSGGRPRPNVTWYLDNAVIDESFETRKDGVTINHLLYPNIGRQHLNARLVCVASNTNLTPPNNKAVVLEVNRKLIILNNLITCIIKMCCCFSETRGSSYYNTRKVCFC
jgi:hypothetical protein